MTEQKRDALLKQRQYAWSMIQKIKEFRMIVEDIDTYMWSELDRLDEELFKNK